MKTRGSMRGFTLVEVLVTLALLAAIAALGTPLTQRWIDDAKVNEASAQIGQAFAKARALALRNAPGRDLGEPNAMLCISQGVVHVHTLADDSAITCGAGSVWHANLAGSPATAVQTSGVDFACLAMNNRGMPQGFTAATGACTVGLSVTISRGSSSAQKNLGG